MATTASLTATEILTDLLTVTPTEDALVYGEGRGRMRRLTLPLDYSRASLAPLPLFQQLNADRPGVLFESVDISRVYGRYSLAVIDPPVLVEGKDDAFCLRALNRHGQDILARLQPADFPCSADVQQTAQASREQCRVSVDQWQRMNGYSSIIFRRLSDISCTPFGVPIAFSASMAPLPMTSCACSSPCPIAYQQIPTQDFRLFLPDILLFYDHLRERALIYLYDFSDWKTAGERGGARPPGAVVYSKAQPCSAHPAAPAPQIAVRHRPRGVHGSRGRSA